MKTTSHPHDPLDELLAAAVHGELTAAQRAELDALLQNDPAARAAYQEILAMHDLLERNHNEAKPDPAFEDRMISGVRRKARADATPRETPWESALVLWRAIKWPFVARPAWTFATALTIVVVALVLALGPITSSREKARQVMAMLDQSQMKQAEAEAQGKSTVVVPTSTVAMTPPSPPQGNAASAWNSNWLAEKEKEQHAIALPDMSSALAARRTTVTAAAAQATPMAAPAGSDFADNQSVQQQSPNAIEGHIDYGKQINNGRVVTDLNSVRIANKALNPAPQSAAITDDFRTDAGSSVGRTLAVTAPSAPTAPALPEDSDETAKAAPVTTAANKPAPAPDTRKLIRDAQLDLEVKSYQKTVDAITELGRGAGGYLDSSNSQRGGNGKLQGTVVVKVLPENLDAVLLKLRDLGEVKNQSVSTQDVTKDYYDTQARLDNSHRMEAQLQLLLQHTNGKVSDLLQVERELERVRGDIEQMQGQLKLYDFQVQYATITITVAEKDLNKAAAYLLQEHDQFSLFVHDVEDAFTQAKTAATTFKAEILNANLQHDSGNSMSATLAFSVPPDQIDGFLAQVKSLGRVDNFTRTTQRVANDGGDPDQPADETRTEKDHVQVQLAIRADDESPRQQTQLAIASTGDIDAQAQQLKDDAVKAGAAVIASNFERAPDGTETATISFRIALSKVGDLMPTVEKLGRVETLTVQRNDRPDQAAADPGAPAEIDLRLHNVPAIRFEDEQPRQATQLAIASTGDVDAQAQQVKSDALQAGMAVTSSTFERQPDGTEQAALTFRLPMTKAADFTATLEKLGKVESLAVQRNDVTGPNSTDPNAPAEISLTLHNEPAVVADDRGFWPTLRHTFGGGIEAFLTSVQTIGVLVAFVFPWAVALVIVAWAARRIYVAYFSRPRAV